MSAARMILRRQESDRRSRVIFENAGPGRRRAALIVVLNDDKTVKERIPRRTSGKHRQGDQWWRGKLADLVERDVASRVMRATAPVPRRPTPEMLPRPPGMSRQVQRRLFREACKTAGVRRNP